MYKWYVLQVLSTHEKKSTKKPLRSTSNSKGMADYY